MRINLQRLPLANNLKCKMISELCWSPIHIQLCPKHQVLAMGTQGAG